MEGEWIENPFEMSFRVRHPLLQRGDQTHQGFASFSAGIGLRPEADLARNDGRAQFPLGAVVVGWEAAMLGPMGESMGVAGAQILPAADAERLSRLGHDGWDLGPQLLSLSVIVWI